MKNLLFGLLILLPTFTYADDFTNRVDGTASGYNESRTCDRALRNALENASELCEEKGQSLGEYMLLGGCGYQNSFFGYDKKVYEVAFECK